MRLVFLEAPAVAMERATQIHAHPERDKLPSIDRVCSQREPPQAELRELQPENARGRQGGGSSRDGIRAPTPFIAACVDVDIIAEVRGCQVRARRARGEQPRRTSMGVTPTRGFRPA